MARTDVGRDPGRRLAALRPDPVDDGPSTVPLRLPRRLNEPGDDGAPAERVPPGGRGWAGIEDRCRPRRPGAAVGPDLEGDRPGRPGPPRRWRPGYASPAGTGELRPARDDDAADPTAVSTAVVGRSDATSERVTPSDPGPPSGRADAVRGRLARVAQRWLPGPVAARLDPGRAGATALVLVVVLAAAVAASGVWSSRPQVQPVAALPAVSAGADPATPTSSGASPAAPVPGGQVVVSVVGKVARPGLVRVPDGARVADAVDAAGGPLPGVDLSVLNLARRIGDGEQIAVGVPAATDAAPGAGPASEAGPGAPIGEPLPSGGSAASAPAAGASGGKVDLNRASAGELDALPGVGPATAAKILDWRTRNGRFARVEQLREVDGIGERKYAQLAPLVTV